MSALTRLRQNLTRPLGAVILLGIAAAVWGVTLRNQLSPSRQHVERGIEFAHKRQAEEAIKEWQEAARLDANDPQPWEYLSEYYLDIHNWQAALDALRQVERLKPETPHLQARLALCSLKTGEELAAYKYAEASLKKEPDDPDTILLFCGLLANTGENQRRLELLRHLAKLQPDNLATQTLLAATLTDKRQFDEARPLVEQILQRDPNNLEVYSLRGMILLNTDSSPIGLKQAESDFLRTVSTPRYAAFAHYNLGKIYKRLGQPQQAVTHLEAAARLTPLKHEVWFELSEASAQAGQTAKADRAQQQSEKLVQEEAAIKALETRVAARPDDFDAQLELAQRFLNRADYRKTDIHLQLARNLRPEDPRLPAVFQKLAEATRASSSTGGQ